MKRLTRWIEFAFGNQITQFWKYLGSALILLFLYTPIVAAENNLEAKIIIVTSPEQWLTGEPILFDASESTGDFVFYEWKILGASEEILTETTFSPAFTVTFNTSGKKAVLLSLIDEDGEIHGPVYQLFSIQSRGGTPPVLSLESLHINSPLSERDDGVAYPGETIQLFLTLQNAGGQTAFDTDGKLIPILGDISIDDNRSVETFGDIAPGDTAANAKGYSITIPDTAEPGTTAILLLQVTYQSTSIIVRGISIIEIELWITDIAPPDPTPTNTPTTTPTVPQLELIDYWIDDSSSLYPDGQANPGETFYLFLTFENIGGESAFDVRVELSTLIDGLIIEESRKQQSFGDLAPGETAVNTAGFQITIPETANPGDLLFLSLDCKYLIGSWGFSGESNIALLIVVNEPLSTTPTSTPIPTPLAPTPYPPGSIEFNGHRIVRDVVPGLPQSGDGAINPGETIAVKLSLTNHTDTAIEGIEATISSGSADITLLNDTVRWNRIGTGETAFSANHFGAVIAQSVTPPHPIPIQVRITGPQDLLLEETFELWALQSVNLGPQSGNGILPTDLVFVDETNRIYVTNERTNTVSVVGRRTAASIPVAAQPGPIMYDPYFKRILVGHQNIPQITVIDPFLDIVTQEKQIDELGGVSGFAVAPSLNRIFVSNKNLGKIFILNAEDLAPVDTLTGFPYISSLAFLESIQVLVVLDSSEQVLSLLPFPDGESFKASIPGSVSIYGPMTVDVENGEIYFGGDAQGQEGIFKYSIDYNAWDFFATDQRVRTLYFDTPSNRLFVSLVKQMRSDPSLIALDNQSGVRLDASNIGSVLGAIEIERKSQDGSLYVIDAAENRLYQFTLDSLNEPKDNVMLGNTPEAAVVDSARGRVYATNRNASLLMAIDTISARILESLYVGDSPSGAAFDPIRNIVYIALQKEDAVLAVSADGALRGIKKYDVPSDPFQVGVDTQRNRIIVSCQSAGKVSIIDPNEGMVTSVDAGRKPFGVAVNERLGRFYVTQQEIESEIFAFETESGNLLKHLELPLGTSPAAIAIDQETGRIYIGMLRHKEVWTFDEELNRIENLTAYIGDIINSLAVDAVRRRLYVSALTAGQLRVFDLDTLEPIRTVDVGQSPFGIAAEEETGCVYVATEVGGSLVFYQDKEDQLTSLPAPESLQTENRDSQVYLQWSRVDGAQGYIVERRQTGRNSYIPLLSIPLPENRTEYIDTDVVNDLTYQYRIRAVDQGERYGTPVISEPVTPERIYEPHIIIKPFTRHIRLVPGEQGSFSIALRPISGFAESIEMALNGGDHPLIASSQIIPASLPDPSAPSVIQVSIETREDSGTYSFIPLEFSITDGEQNEIIDLFLEMIPQREISDEFNSERETRIQKFLGGVIPISLTMDRKEDPSGNMIAIINGEIAVTQLDTSIDLNIQKPDGETIDLPGVLVENSRFSASIPTGSQEEGLWRITAAFRGNDLVPAGQSSQFLLPIETGGGGRKNSQLSIRMDEKPTGFSDGSFIFAAGPPSNMRSQSFIDGFIDRVDTILKQRNFSEGQLRVMRADGGLLIPNAFTLNDLRNAIKETTSLNPLILYFLTDINQSGQLIINETERLSPGDLNEILEQDREGTPSVIIVDGYRANLFIENMNQENKVLIASTGSGEANTALFGVFSDGAQFSFSNFFLDAIHLGKNIEDSFAVASQKMITLQGPFITQIPRLYVENESLAQSPLGMGVETPLAPLTDRIPPTITDLIQNQNAEMEETHLSLEIEAQDNREIQSVVAILGDSTQGIKIPLKKNEATGRYNAGITADDLPPTTPDQTFIPVSVICTDTSGNLSEPVVTSILIGDKMTWVQNWWKM